MKDKIVTYTFVIFISLFMIMSTIIKDKDVSKLERRVLKSTPNIKELLSSDNTYFSDLNSYFEDQFPFRDKFINTKSILLNKIVLNKINHNVLDYNDNLFEIDSSVNEKSIKHLINKITLVDKLYDIGSNSYFIMLPDKNYYLDSDIPKMDYDYMENSLKYYLPASIKWIDVKDTLNIDSYYKTDIHFKQDKLENLLSRIRNNMDLSEYPYPNKIEKYKPFYGALYSKGSNKNLSDTINVLYNDSINNSKVYNYEKKKYTTIYDKNNFNNIDGYDIFLEGASPLIIIDNSNSQSKKELVMFRDSFSSTLAPLLIDNYSKITLIDLRYVSSMSIKNIDEVKINKDTDVLFVYSIPIINNSFSLK